MRNKIHTSDQLKDDTNEKWKTIEKHIDVFSMETAKNNENGEWYCVICEKKMSYCDMMCIVYITHRENGQEPLQIDFHLSECKKWNDWSIQSEYWIDCRDIRFVFNYFSASIFSNVFWTLNGDENKIENNNKTRIKSGIVSKLVR